MPRKHLNGCQGVKTFLLKDPINFFLSLHKLRFVLIQVLSHFFKFFFLSHYSLSFVKIGVLSNFEVLIFFSHYLFFSQFSLFEFLSLVTIKVFEFCQNLRFLVLSYSKFLSYFTIWVFDFHHNMHFQFYHNLSFWVLLQFEFLSFSKRFFFVKEKKWKIFFWWTNLLVTTVTTVTTVSTVTTIT